MSDRVTLVEVGPRDGLQNEPSSVPPAERARLVDALAAAGLTFVEAGAFVSPKAVPQMAGSAEVLSALSPRAGVRYPVLTPNWKGYEAARAAGARDVAIFGAASETFCQKNTNCSIAESFDRFVPIMEAAKRDGIAVRGYVSCVLGCPYEGDVPIARVVEVATRLYEMGCYEISLGDTIGVGTARAARELVRTLKDVMPVGMLAAHFHDTYGQALANLYACLEEGVRVVDTSVAGLGGCPYAPGASGNVATEDVLFMLNGLGMETGVDLDAVIEIAASISQTLGRPPASKTARALLAKH
ncbi:MAG: hydroxymethylglutaryl-CoA lyase [Pseudomonadota bacterium]